MGSTIARRAQKDLVTALSKIAIAATAPHIASPSLHASTSSSSSQIAFSASTPASRFFSASTTTALAAEAPVAAAVASDASSQASTSATTSDSASNPKWTTGSRRVGLLARKRGMATYFLSSGESVPCTVLQVDSNQISAQVGFAPAMPPATHDEKGSPLKVPKVAPYLALQVAATDVNSNTGISRTVLGHLKKAGIRRPKRVLSEFKITHDALLPLGTVLSASHFVPGQAVDVSATSRGKGFQGPMKRHGFSGLRASHGVSISHRSHGSTGQHQDPGRVFPGKKMAGRMGGHSATVHNLRVLRVDLDRQLVLVQGNVPGPDGGMVKVSDAKRALLWKSMSRQHRFGLRGVAALPEGLKGLPFPAGTKETEQGLPRVIEWTGGTEAATSD
ncbi:unnamed protein product [Parajaminaea phylloscopi]